MSLRIEGGYHPSQDIPVQHQSEVYPHLPFIPESNSKHMTSEGEIKFPLTNSDPIVKVNIAPGYEVEKSLPRLSQPPQEDHLISVFYTPIDFGTITSHGYRRSS